MIIVNGISHKHIKFCGSTTKEKLDMYGYKLPLKRIRLACSCGLNCGYFPDTEGIWFASQGELDAELFSHRAVCSGELQMDEMLPDGRYPYYIPPADCLGDLPLAA